MADDNTGGILGALFSRNYIRPETINLGISPIAALLQMTDPVGLTPAQMDQNAAMRAPLYQRGLFGLGQIAAPPAPPNDPGSGIAQRNSLAEDLNSIMLKYNNWRKLGLGQELTPQERITQGFLDVRNPNSRF